MDVEIETNLKVCMIKLKEAALTLAMTHHKIKYVPELNTVSRDVADALANVSALALVIQSTLK